MVSTDPAHGTTRAIDTQDKNPWAASAGSPLAWPVWRWLGLALLLAIAWRTMSAGFHRLLWDPTMSGAIDLKILHDLVADWFAGRPTYETNGAATYPPASHVLLWPLLGWGPVPVLRWVWAVAFLAALIGLMVLVCREIQATTWWERAYVVLIVLAMNAAGVCVGNGQLILFLLPPLLLAVFWVRRRPASWASDGWVAVLFLVTLVKPSISAPFFWLLLVYPRRWRPATFVVAGYLVLTWVAMLFRSTQLATSVPVWLNRGSDGASWGGYGNVQMALAVVGLPSWMMPASLVILLALGAWVYRYRDRDLWLLLGVTGIVARIWIYHRVYDDVLILLPAITLYRLAKQEGLATKSGRVAAGLCGALVASLVAPGPWHDIAPPLRHWYDLLHVGVWMVALLFLLRAARAPTSER